MSYHSPRSPSGAHRYMRCFGAPNAEAGLPDIASEFAAEGTVYHDVVSTCLECGLDPRDFAGAKMGADGFVFTVDDDMVRFAEGAIQRIRELATGNRLVVEVRVNLEPWLGKGESGTCDVGIIDAKRREITVWDHKYGSGVPISPVDNEQLQLYALGLWNDIGSELLGSPEGVMVRLVIDQPRAYGGGGEWMTSLADLFAFGERAKAAVRASYHPAAPRTAGEKQCTFCKAKKTCGELARFNLEMFGAKFEDLDEAIDMGIPPLSTPVEDLTSERRAYIVKHKGIFEKWLKTLHAVVLTDALAGRPTPGMKAVYGRAPHRKYRNEREAETFLTKRLGDAAYEPRQLKSPAQAEKLLDKDSREDLKTLIDFGQRKPVLVDESDPNDPIPVASEKFDIEEDEDPNII